MAPGENVAGHLLVAVPGVLEDLNFRRTVVLMLEHGQQGALGVILNRPTDTRVQDPFPGWDDASSAPAVLFAGGPVQQSTIVALGRSVDPAEQDGFQQVIEIGDARIGTVDLRREPYTLAPSLDELRVFAGYSGWSAGQLESEISQGAWWVIDVDADDPFLSTPDDLWRVVLGRQRGIRSLYARCPDDPSLN